MPESNWTGPILKPVTKKKKKKVNGWKDKPNRYCAYCGAPYAERHEVFYGTGNRQISIDNGFQVDVCAVHHRELHERQTPWAIEETKRLRQRFQREWEEKLIKTGIRPEQARELWIQLIGRSYVDD